MKRLLMIIVCVVCGARIASAELLVHDPFDHSTGSLTGNVAPNGKTWHRAGPAGGADVAVVGGNLVYPLYPAPAGNSLTVGGVGSNSFSSRVEIGDFREGTFYYSFYMQALDLTPLADFGVFFAGFNTLSGQQDGTVSVVGTRVVIRREPGDTTNSRYQLGTVKNSSVQGTISWHNQGFDLESRVLIVGQYEINGAGLSGETDDVSRMWINPTSFGNTEDNLPTPDLVNNWGTDLLALDEEMQSRHQIRSFVWRQSHDNLPLVHVDELRVGTTYASVTPFTPAIPGDANLDGVVNIADLSLLASNWQQSPRHWEHGDFNGDQLVNIADLSLLASHWQVSVSGSFTEALAMFDVFNGIVVPEPASIGLLVMSGMLLRRRIR